MIHATRYPLHAIRSGFTLLELLLAMAVFAVITGAVVVNFRIGERSTQLRLGAEGLASTMRALQNKTLSGATVELCGQAPPGAPADQDNFVCTGRAEICSYGCTRQFPSGGYGFRISSGAVAFFADSNANHFYDEGEALSNADFALASGVIVDAAATLPLDDDGALTATFMPPAADIWINGRAPGATGEIQVGLTQEKTGQIRQVVIKTASGRIEVH